MKNKIKTVKINKHAPTVEQNMKIKTVKNKIIFTCYIEKYEK